MSETVSPAFGPWRERERIYADTNSIKLWVAEVLRGGDASKLSDVALAADRIEVRVDRLLTEALRSATPK